MTRRSDPEIDRLLARGRPAGPELDQVWSRVSERLERDQAQATLGHPSSRRKRWHLALAALLPVAAAAAVLLVVWPGGDNAELVARGGDSDLPTIEATCGEVEAPCTVGSPVYLRTSAGAEPGLVAVSLEQHSKQPLLLGHTHLAPGQARVLPIEIIPEAEDVEAGLHIQLWFVPEAQVDDDPPPVEQFPRSILKWITNHHRAHKRSLVLRVARP